ncbi:glucose-1-phosphate thymidylyltransferase [Fictibacillus macauensis ZFHKF-1]|uniref:Glucose-1-phosphate thymidylyltransferase n=1 Tax=Fictibacillus macauensis ZFHKF-1 TaxID=1196324 RepID=I8J3D1_9BACL|nr:sugar phosphate nucleotidyltransferase [Fictibacillus macauensis]EIT86276.1 glucose-1-phosphate thymidylyltransferase [Fictibacillus macauensis ZFHKF-1]
MKGIIMTESAQTKLAPMTTSVAKQLVPVYDKPMVYYSLAVFLLAGITEILIIVKPKYLFHYQSLLSNGQHLGITISYAVQAEQTSLEESIVLAEEFIDHEPVAMLQGMSLLYSTSFSEKIAASLTANKGALLFVKEDAVHSSPLAVYDEKATTLARHVLATKDTTLHELYAAKHALQIVTMNQAMLTFDLSAPAGVLRASQFIETVQQQYGCYVACLEEIAFTLGYITEKQLLKLAHNMENSAYKTYLLGVLTRSS